jgi:hypothetical protein
MLLVTADQGCAPREHTWQYKSPDTDPYQPAQLRAHNSYNFRGSHFLTDPHLSIYLLVQSHHDHLPATRASIGNLELR